MQLKDFINYRVETVSPDDTLQRVAEKMRDLDVGSMPVCTGSQLIGIVTDRDITIRATTRGDDPMVTRVKEVMTPDVIWCRADDTVEEAARLMQEHQIRRLFVLNENDELVGVTSLGELVTASGDQQLAGETLERVSESAESGQIDGDELTDPDKEAVNSGQAEVLVSGLFDDREHAREALDELKEAGFADNRIAIATHDIETQDSFLNDTGVDTVPTEEIPNLPELDEGQVLIMVEAEDRATLALEIINRNQGVTGGVRLPT